MSAEETELRAVTRPEAIGETADLIRDWHRAVTFRENLDRQLEDIKKQIATTERRLGRHLTPSDAEEGENFHVWFGDGLLAVRVRKGFGDGIHYEVYWRKRPVRSI